MKTDTTTYTRAPGFLGDHELVDFSVGRGMALTPREIKLHNWEGAPDDWRYDEGMANLADRCIEWLANGGITVVSEED